MLGTPSLTLAQSVSEIPRRTLIMMAWSVAMPRLRRLHSARLRRGPKLSGILLPEGRCPEATDIAEHCLNPLTVQPGSQAKRLL